MFFNSLYLKEGSYLCNRTEYAILLRQSQNKMFLKVTETLNIVEIDY